MGRSVLLNLLVGITLTTSAHAAVVVHRWGVSGHVQHHGVLSYEPAGDGRTLIRFDLSMLPRGTKVYRARLFFTRPGLYGSRFEIVPANKEGAGEQTVLKPSGPALRLVPPYFRWFDATATVRQWVQASQPTGSLLLKTAPDFAREATYLEIAYEGELKSPPQQVHDVETRYRSGQVFITFREIEDYAGGREEITWGELSKRFRDVQHSGAVPRDDPREIRYRVYEHEKPITPTTISEARLLADVSPGSVYNAQQVPRGDFIKRAAEAPAIRLGVEPDKPLPPGFGLYVHTVDRPGRRYYAVVTAVDGAENTAELSEGNTAGPIDVKPDEPEPVRQVVPQGHGRTSAGRTELRDGKVYQEDWYSYWAVPPNAPWPSRYDFAVGYCPDTLAKPAPLTFTRGHVWNHNPEMPRPEARRGIVISMSDDPPNGVCTGINDARETLKGIDQGVWRPVTQNRQEALIRWAQRHLDVDDTRMVSATGAWGMWEIRRPDLYAYIHGWGMPEVTKGFQLWNWSRGAWGPPEAYAGVPDDRNPWVLQDYTRFVLEDPRRELPYFWIHTGWGAHFTEMGWPPFPRFCRAMIDTRRAFCMQSRVVADAIRDGRLDIRRDQSLPAFGNCSLDDNLGSGELGTGVAFGQINGYLLWDSQTIVDEPRRWEITVWLDESAPLTECAVDLAPRRCQRFEVQPGQQLSWSNALEEEESQPVASGTVVADKWGLVTIKQLSVGKANHRIAIKRD